MTLTTRERAAQDTMVAYLSACKAHDMEGARNAYRALQDLRHGIVTTTEAVRHATPSVHAQGAYDPNRPTFGNLGYGNY